MKRTLQGCGVFSHFCRVWGGGGRCYSSLQLMVVKVPFLEPCADLF